MHVVRTIRNLTTPLLLLLVLAGCATGKLEPEDWPTLDNPPIALQPGDTLQVQFAYWPELDQEQSVRPDGKIALKLVGEVAAAGLTPEELRQDLLTRYADKIRNPEINVVVRAFNSHRVFVGGEVINPGLIMIQGQLTALEAIMMAGGFNKQSAKTSNVIIIRQHEGQQIAKSIKLNRAYTKTHSEPFYLQPHDVIFVPRTTIDKVDQWMDKYFKQLLPPNVYYSFNQSVPKAKSNSVTRSNSFQVQLP